MVNRTANNGAAESNEKLMHGSIFKLELATGYVSYFNLLEEEQTVYNVENYSVNYIIDYSEYLLV